MLYAAVLLHHKKRANNNTIMAKEISINYEVNGTETAVPLNYIIEMIGAVQTIVCTVRTSGFHVPAWLQLRKFELKSVLSDGSYMPLFTDNSNIKNMDTALFIDKAYDEIMIKEKFAMAV